MLRTTLTTKMVAQLLAATILLSSCTSTTLIQSTPSGAKLYLDGEPVGTTPYQHSDTKIIGSYTEVRLEQPGYEPLYTGFSRGERADVGAIIAGFFFLVPFLWATKYKPSHFYEMTPTLENNQVQDRMQPTLRPASNSDSMAEKIRELNGLLQDNMITQEEYDAQKKKILEGNPQ